MSIHRFPEIRKIEIFVLNVYRLDVSVSQIILSRNSPSQRFRPLFFLPNDRNILAVYVRGVKIPNDRAFLWRSLARSYTYRHSLHSYVTINVDKCLCVSLILNITYDSTQLLAIDDLLPEDTWKTWKMQFRRKIKSKERNVAGFQGLPHYARFLFLKR